MDLGTKGRKLAVVQAVFDQSHDRHDQRQLHFVQFIEHYVEHYDSRLDGRPFSAIHPTYGGRDMPDVSTAYLRESVVGPGVKRWGH